MTIYLSIGLFASLAGFALGVAHARRKERSLRQSQMATWQQSFEKRYYNILNHASIGMANVALDNRFIEVNHAFCELLGYAKEDLEKLTLQQITHPDDLAVNLFNVERLLNEEIGSYQLENRYLCKDGNVVWVLQTGSVLRDNQNRALNFIVQVQDITEHKHAEQALREDEYILRRMLDNVPARISYWNSELRNEFANIGYEEWFGFTPEQMHGRHMREIIGEKRYAMNEHHLQGVLRGEPQLFERAVKNMKGIDRYTQISYNPDISGGKVKGFFVLVTDITQRRQAEMALRASERRFRKVLESAPIGMALLSLDNHFTQVNRAFCRISGYGWEELLNLTVEDITHPDDTRSYQSIAQHLKTGGIDTYEIEKRYIQKDGQIVWVLLTASLLRDDEGAPQRIIKQVQDIIHRKKLERELERQAHTDYLTGLANRRHFLELAEHEIAHARRYGGELSVAMLDLDHFKNVNDTYGHQVGDVVLKELAKICQRTLREVDVIGRLGGEEFAILFPETGGNEAYDIIERLREAIATTAVPLEHAQTLHFTASIGIASFVRADANIDILLNRADKALYEAKISGRNRIVEAAA
ncbi:MAG TPA: PAS domain S-box protein [Novimethylophilus sp.]|jgi:diguanylate cyclase (GGDEF)-like protein/PAS domain S-box-containing protein|uniref:PAS domain S-box protein n=1 Tax=Novimethylophilus sp. TaxID=2137426 RepID=UPI002F4146BA